DDLHWAGPDALDLLATLLAADASPAIRLIGAYRDSESAADARLGEFVADLARASRVRVLGLEPLSEAEAQQLLVQLAADTEEMQAMLPAIVRRAGGVPFFLVSFVEDVRAADPATTRHTSVPHTPAQPSSTGRRSPTGSAPGRASRRRCRRSSATPSISPAATTTRSPRSSARSTATRRVATSRGRSGSRGGWPTSTSGAGVATS